jgi:Sec-independent protein translocase protein TatA
MAVLMVIGLLLYGRNLPEAGRALGRVAAQFRRGLHDFKQQMDREGDLQEMKRTFQGTAAELKRAAEVPRAHLDPKSLLTSDTSGQETQDRSPWHQEVPGVAYDSTWEPMQPPGSNLERELAEEDKADKSDLPSPESPNHEQGREGN